MDTTVPKISTFFLPICHFTPGTALPRILVAACGREREAAGLFRFINVAVKPPPRGGLPRRGGLRHSYRRALMSKKHPRTIAAQQAHDLLAKDPSVMLVCAYEKDEEFRQYDLAGAIPLSEFRKRAISVPKDENVIFYCASSAMRRRQNRHRSISTKASSTPGFSRAASMPGKRRATSLFDLLDAPGTGRAVHASR